MATGSLTATFTKNGAHSSAVYTSRINSFLTGNGTTVLENSSTAFGQVITFYGLNLEQLRGLPNLEITGVTVSVYCGSYSASGSSGNKTVVRFRLVKGFDTNPDSTSTNVYTDLGDGDIYVINKKKYERTTFTVSQTSFPNAFNTIKDDINSFLNGYTTNSFGLRMFYTYATLVSLSVTVNYSYSVPIKVTTNASPAEGGTVTGGGTYESGSTVTATATPNEGYKFSHWLVNGANAGSSNPISGALTADTTVTAVFEKSGVNNIFIGTAQPSAIYIGTQKVKGIYIGTTAVYET